MSLPVCGYRLDSSPLLCPEVLRAELACRVLELRDGDAERAGLGQDEMMVMLLLR